VDIVARVGGDEFAIVQVAAEQPRGAIILADRLIETLAKPFDLDGHQVVIGTSIGIALAPLDGLDTDQLIKNADMALYRAKADGRGVFRFFEPEMDAKMQARRTLEIDLRKALAEGEFELFYQPLVNLASNEVSGFEALLRWNHPTRGLVSPSEFIPIAEEMGLIAPLGERILRQACAEAAGWPDDIKVAVNLSPVQFKSKTLALAVTSALASSGLPPHRLELEISESVLLQDNEATLTTLHQLRQLGVRISMDDFGTGYSSLSYLRSFPFDKIKIDQSFVRDLSGKEDSLAIIRAVAGLGRNLGMATTAEGVETREQLGYLRQEGCTEVQGYLFSRPLPARNIIPLLESVRNELRPAA
jgi:predicted signal transduction protein with EAL and GGDEF domain